MVEIERTGHEVDNIALSCNITMEKRELGYRRIIGETPCFELV